MKECSTGQLLRLIRLVWKNTNADSMIFRSRLRKLGVKCVYCTCSSKHSRVLVLLTRATTACLSSPSLAINPENLLLWERGNLSLNPLSPRGRILGIVGPEQLINIQGTQLIQPILVIIVVMAPVICTSCSTIQSHDRRRFLRVRWQWCFDGHSFQALTQFTGNTDHGKSRRIVGLLDSREPLLDKLKEFLGPSWVLVDPGRNEFTLHGCMIESNVFQGGFSVFLHGGVFSFFLVYECCPLATSTWCRQGFAKKIVHIILCKGTDFDMRKEFLPSVGHVGGH